MTRLRSQIEQAKAGYLAAHYPGDLAAELLPATRSRRRWVIVSAVGALAAALAIAFALVRLLAPAADTITVTQEPPADPQVVQIAWSAQMPAMPAFPEDVSLLPEPDSFTDMPAMPSFPGWSDIEQESPTTQESIS